MFEIVNAVKNAKWSVQSVKLAGMAAILFAVPAFLTVPAQAQDRDNRTFACQSADGQRTFCPADMSSGSPQLTKQLGDIRCVEGYTWGRQDDGVWVDRGCRAEFQLPPEPRRRVERTTRIEAGTELFVRTNETISANRVDGRIFTGVVDQDVLGENGRLAIPRGSNVELIVRVAHDQDLILDLESVMVDGQRYAIDVKANRVDADAGGNARAGKLVGGGAIMGAIIGAAAGGGKGAAIGAGIGAGAGVATAIATSGREVRVPSESVIRFRVDSPMTMGVADEGSLGDGFHYHR